MTVGQVCNPNVATMPTTSFNTWPCSSVLLADVIRLEQHAELRTRP